MNIYLPIDLDNVEREKRIGWRCFMFRSGESRDDEASPPPVIDQDNVNPSEEKG